MINHINCIQNERFCLRNMFVYCVYLLGIYINTHTCMDIFTKNMLCLNIFIYNIDYMNIMEISCKYKKYIHACVCIYTYILNIHSTHTFYFGCD